MSFGGAVGWEGEGSPIKAASPSITHHIVDRPKLPASYNNYPKNREYVQPQWVFDSTNNGFLLPCGKYAVGAELPAHLSPWVDNEKEGYTPRYAEEIEKLKRGEIVSDDLAVGTSGSESEDADEAGADGSGSDSDSESEVEEDKDEEEEKQEKKKKKQKTTSAAAKKNVNEEHEMAKMMMSKKAARLYGRMQNGINNKAAEAENLMQVSGQQL